MMSNLNLIVKCREGDVSAVQQMIAGKCDVNVEVDGENPLSVAIVKNNRPLTSLLLDAGATLQQLSTTPLQLAVASGSADVTELFLSRGMDVCVEYIVDAACIGHHSIVVLLLNNFKPQRGGASILHLLSSMTQPDENPLHKAAVDLIIEESPALLNAIDRACRTPLLRAAEGRQAYLASALIKAGADVNAAGGRDRRTALMIASDMNDLAVVKVLLSAGPVLRINARDADGNTALHLSAESLHLPVVKALLEARADVNAANKQDMNLLCYTRSAAIANALLDAGAGVDHKGLNGLPPVLHTGSCEVMETLINRNADVGVRTEAGRTVLMKAAMEGNLDMMQLLLATPATASLISERNSKGATALFFAVHKKYPRIVDALLAAGADPNIATDDGVTPLMVARDADMAQHLLDGGADVSLRVHNGITALAHAIMNDRDISFIAFLVNCGADVAAADNNGWNSLMLAAYHNQVVVMRLLFTASATQVNAQTHDGRTALIVASAQGHTAAVEALIAAGADVHLANNKGRTALHIAENVDIARLLWNAGARDAQTHVGRNTLMFACLRNKPDVAEFLLQCGLDVNAAHQDYTPLMLAAEKGHLDLLRVLLAADPPVEVDRRDNTGVTALFKAVISNHPLAVRMLLSHGANIDTADNTGYTVLMHAAHNDRLEVLEELLRARPPTLLDARSRGGWTALSIAVAENYPRIVDALLAAGADPNIATDDGVTPLTEARDAEMAQRLLDGGADVNARFQNGFTALTDAIMEDKDTSFVALLLERGADVTASHDDGWNSLMLAAGMNRVDVLKLLLAATPSAAVDHQNNRRQTALFIAVRKDSLASARLLLDVGANPCIASNAGKIPLMNCRSPESVKMLVNAAPDMVNHVCNKGRRALSYLTSLEVLQELFASCARHNIHVDVNHADLNGDTALHMTMLKRSGPEAVKLLLEKGAEVFGVGYGGTTVLMKPFLIEDGDHVVREYGIRAPDESHEDDDDLTDSSISACFEALIHHEFARDVAVASVSVLAVGSDGDGGMVVDDGSAGDEPSAKRQRR